MFSESIERTYTAVDAASACGNEQAVFHFSSILWTLGHGILGSPRLETCIIDVGRQQIYAGCPLAPEIDEMCKRTSRRVFTWASSTTVHGGIDIEWHVVDTAGGLCQMFHIAGI